MTVLEGPDYQNARDRIKGNPVIRMMAASVATVPLAQIAHEDGAPRFNQVHAAGQPRLRRRLGAQRGQPPVRAVPGRPGQAPRADRRGRARRARSGPRDSRVLHGRARRQPGIRRRDPDHRAAAGRGVTRSDRPRNRDAAMSQPQEMAGVLIRSSTVMSVRSVAGARQASVGRRAGRGRNVGSAVHHQCHEQICDPGTAHIRAGAERLPDPAVLRWPARSRPEGCAGRLPCGGWPDSGPGRAPGDCRRGHDRDCGRLDDALPGASEALAAPRCASLRRGRHYVECCRPWRN